MGSLIERDGFSTRIIVILIALDKELNKSNKNWCNSVAVHKKTTTAS